MKSFLFLLSFVVSFCSVFAVRAEDDGDGQSMIPTENNQNTEPQSGDNLFEIQDNVQNKALESGEIQKSTDEDNETPQEIIPQTTQETIPQEDIISETEQETSPQEIEYIDMSAVSQDSESLELVSDTEQRSIAVDGDIVMIVWK